MRRHRPPIGVGVGVGVGVWGSVGVVGVESWGSGGSGWWAKGGGQRVARVLKKGQKGGRVEKGGLEDLVE